MMKESNPSRREQVSTKAVMLTALMGVMGSLEACAAQGQQRNTLSHTQAENGSSHARPEIERIVRNRSMNELSEIISRDVEADRSGAAPRADIEDFAVAAVGFIRQGQDPEQQSAAYQEGSQVHEVVTRLAQEGADMRVTYRTRTLTYENHARPQLERAVEEARGLRMTVDRAGMAVDPALSPANYRVVVHHIETEPVTMPTEEEAVQAAVWRAVADGSEASTMVLDDARIEQGKITDRPGHAYSMLQRSGWLRLQHVHLNASHVEGGWRVQLVGDAVRPVRTGE